MQTIRFGTGDWNPHERPLLADGAWGTEFIKHGLAPGDGPEIWNMDRPDVVVAVAAGYVRAGSDIVLTNSFGANSIQLTRHGLADRATEINIAAARLTARAIAEHGGSAVVAGDIGPCGKMVAVGEIDEEVVYAAFLEQATALREGGAEWIVIETMIDKLEMAAAVRAAATTGLPVVASMTYERGAQAPHAYHTIMGDSPEACVAAALEAGASVIGANCGAGIDAYVDLARRLRGLTDAPIWIKANAGLPTIEGGRTVYRMTPESYCSYVPSLLDAGVNVIGGCCGTDPRFVAGMRAVIDGRAGVGV